MKAKIRQSVLAAIKAEPTWLNFINCFGLFMGILLMLTQMRLKKSALFSLVGKNFKWFLKHYEK
jgi:hypothetical protein